MNTLKLLIRTSRPSWWFFIPSIFLAGSLFVNLELSWIFFLQVFLLSFPYSLFMFGINDIYDHDSDIINPRKKRLGGIRHERSDYVVIKRYVLLSGLLLLVSSLITLNYINIIGMVSLLFVTYYYSAPPLRFKSRPVIDSLSNGLSFFLVFLMIISFSTEFFIPKNIYFLSLLIAVLHSFYSIPDYSSDKAVGHKTISVLLGKRVAAFFSFIISLLILLFVHFNHVIILYVLAFYTFLFFLGFINPKEKFVSFLFWVIFFSTIILVFSFFLVNLLS